jgi:hypothetical protein
MSRYVLYIGDADEAEAWRPEWTAIGLVMRTLMHGTRREGLLRLLSELHRPGSVVDGVVAGGTGVVLSQVRLPRLITLAVLHSS